MKTNIGGGILYLAKCVLFFFIILLLQSCTSTFLMRLEGSDFKENLYGVWEGKWYFIDEVSGKERIKIIKIDGDKVHLTGYREGDNWTDTEEVYGRIENSALILTWPAAQYGKTREEYTMKRDDSNNLILDGFFTVTQIRGEVQLKKIE